LFEADKNMNEPQQHLTQFPVLTTNRLLLRQLADNDIPALVNLRSDAEVNKYLNRPKSTTAEEAGAFVKKINNGLNKEWHYWVISLKEDQKLIGTICLWNFNEANKSVEIGYELLPAFQGNGLMYKALSGVISFGFAVRQFRSIIAHTDSNNERSKNLLEKSGFVPNPTLAEKLLVDDPGNTDVVYSLPNPLYAI
jgi:ribosomal-protein-alanine N-acetyltransferase